MPTPARGFPLAGDVAHESARPRRSRVAASLRSTRVPRGTRSGFQGAHVIATPFVRLLVAGGQNALDGLR